MVAELVPGGSPESVLDFPMSAIVERDLRSAWPVVGQILDLLIDWDLLTVEIALDELREWLDVPGSLCAAVLDQLAGLAGVHVVHKDALLAVWS